MKIMKNEKCNESMKIMKNAKWIMQWKNMKIMKNENEEKWKM